MKIISEATLDLFRQKQRCEWCVRVASLDAHHWKPRGIGGGSRLDIKENLIGLCRECHNRAESGDISRSAILETIADREGLTPEQVQELIWSVLAKKKPLG